MLVFVDNVPELNQKDTARMMDQETKWIGLSERGQHRKVI